MIPNAYPSLSHPSLGTSHSILDPPFLTVLSKIVFLTNLTIGFCTPQVLYDKMFSKQVYKDNSRNPYMILRILQTAEAGLPC
jgi:hypothetical protein